MKHYAIEGAAAVHVFAFVSATDPALNPANQVAPGKGWWDTAEERLKFRNEANTAWLYVGVAGVEV